MEKVTARDVRSALLIGSNISVAETSLSRARGLLGKSGLKPGEGLWIRPSSGVHTFGMAFAIDVIGLNQHFEIVKLWECLKPNRLTSVSWSVKSVLELRAGSIALAQVEIGDRLDITKSFMEHDEAL